MASQLADWLGLGFLLTKQRARVYGAAHLLSPNRKAAQRCSQGSRIYVLWRVCPDVYEASKLIRERLPKKYYCARLIDDPT